MEDLFSIYLLFPLSFIMGFVNSIAGGGGVFGIPAMIAMGIPPLNALALNRWADIGNLTGSLKNYMGIEDFDLKKSLIIIPPMIAGAVIGALFITNISDSLRNIIVLIAVFIGICFLLYPFKPKELSSGINLWLGIPAIFALGLWDGAFAMAGGTLGVIILVMLFKRSYLGAKSTLTLAQVPETLISVTILSLSATITAMEAIVMILASTIGAYIGSKTAIKKGNQFIRYAMAAMALVMAVKIAVFDIPHIF